MGVEDFRYSGTVKRDIESYDNNVTPLFKFSDNGNTADILQDAVSTNTDDALDSVNPALRIIDAAPNWHVAAEVKSEVKDDKAEFGEKFNEIFACIESAQWENGELLVQLSETAKVSLGQYLAGDLFRAETRGEITPIGRESLFEKGMAMLKNSKQAHSIFPTEGPFLDYRNAAANDRSDR